MHCEAHRHGTENELPPPRVKAEPVRKQRTLLVIRRKGRILLAPSTRVRGFWDLPEPDTPGLSSVRIGKKLGVFRHAIMSCLYNFEVREARGAPARNPDGRQWGPVKKLNEIPLRTAARKALSGLG